MKLEEPMSYADIACENEECLHKRLISPLLLLYLKHKSHQSS